MLKPYNYGVAKSFCLYFHINKISGKPHKKPGNRFFCILNLKKVIKKLDKIKEKNILPEYYKSTNNF